MQPGERQIGLGLHTFRAENQHPRRSSLYRVAEQGGLADPRLAANHQGAAYPPVSVLQQTVDHRALVLAPEQPRSRLLKP